MTAIKKQKNMTGKNIYPGDAKPGLTDYAIAAFSGMALAFSFQDFGLWPLAWVGMAPLLFILRGKAIHFGAALGFTAGMFYFGPTITWLSNTMIDYGQMPVWLAGAVNILAVLYVSLFLALFGYLVSRIDRKMGGDMALAAAPFLWVALELVRTQAPPFAFPWARIADSQFNVLPVIQIADFTGEEGLGFLIVFVNSALAAILIWIADGKKSWSRFPARWAALCVMLITATISYGYLQLDSFKKAKGKKIRVALIQGNVDQSRKWERSYRKKQLDIYINRTLKAGERGARLVVWPETAAPFYFGSDRLNDKLILNLVKTVGAPIIFGAPASINNGDKTLSYNRAWIVRPDGYRGKYDKIHLVPFGEYVPMQKLLFFVDKMVTAIGSLEPGDDLTLLDAGDYKVGAQICFEIIFPAYSRRLAADGAGVIVNITNDSWFGKSAASSQSLAMAVFRAVENRTPVLRAAQSGVSAIISKTGRITGRTELFTETTVLGEFNLRSGPATYYTRWGGVFPWLCLAVSILFFSFTINLKRKKT